MEPGMQYPGVPAGTVWPPQIPGVPQQPGAGLAPQYPGGGAGGDLAEIVGAPIEAVPLPAPVAPPAAAVPGIEMDAL